MSQSRMRVSQFDLLFEGAEVWLHDTWPTLEEFGFLPRISYII